LMLAVAEEENLCVGSVCHSPQQVASEEDRFAVVTAGYDAYLAVVLCHLIPFFVEVC